jgi:hypothetical protein
MLGIVSVDVVEALEVGPETTEKDGSPGFLPYQV